MIRVTRKTPCPICGRPDWCGISEDGAIAICMRIASTHPAKNGGWVHKVADGRARYVPPVARPPARPPLFSGQSLIKAWTAATSLTALYDLADVLGVSASSLADLGACWAALHDAWAFPMRDEHGGIIGIRLRSMTGRKWAVSGSREGLFYPVAKNTNPVAVVCEGPTDTAAALTIGLNVVGRPSCLGGLELFRNFVRARGVTQLIIITDNDDARRRPGGGWWQPGQDGAAKLARHCGLPCRIVVPPVKDVRDWVRAGLTAEHFHLVAQQQMARTYGW